MERFEKAGEEILLGDMGLVASHKILDVNRIRAFQYRKTGYVERLESMGGMGRHTERNNIVILAVFFELDRVVAFITVKDKKTFSTFSTRFNMFIKILNLF